MKTLPSLGTKPRDEHVEMTTFSSPITQFILEGFVLDRYDDENESLHGEGSELEQVRQLGLSPTACPAIKLKMFSEGLMDHYPSMELPCISTPGHIISFKYCLYIYRA
jgi:hypothetical protein